MPKFRYSTDSGVTWTDVDDDLPYNIAVTAEQDVIVEPIGSAVSNLGTISGNFLSLTYDAGDPGADVAAFTNIAGTFYWAITASMTPPSAAAIIAGTGFVEAGSEATVAGAFAFELPTLSGDPDLYLHAVVDGTDQTNVDTVRVYIGEESTFVTISSTTGSPNITDYTDGDGTWRAYEWTGDGSFTVSVGGGVEYELLAGGGAGAGDVAFVNHGGGGAGGLLTGTTTLTPGTYPVVIGQGAVYNTATPSLRDGGNSTALGLTAIGGGGGGRGNNGTGRPGGSGGGGGNGLANGGAGTSGQGFAGATGGNCGKGGGGAGGAGAVGANSTSGGAGGVGITSTITGTSRDIAGGGAGSGNPTPGTASFGGGSAPNNGNGTNTAGGNATAPGAGGGGATGTGMGGSGFRGHFVIRVQTA